MYDEVKKQKDMKNLQILISSRQLFSFSPYPLMIPFMFEADAMEGGLAHDRATGRPTVRWAN
jgi:hypothetical protein